jgi:hypothetical protein
MKFTTSALGPATYFAVTLWAGAALAQATGTAPGCCGAPPIHDSPQKSMVGTAVNSTNSSIYFTGYEGNVSEIYYPTVDTLAAANMEFLVGDAAKTFVTRRNCRVGRSANPTPNPCVGRRRLAMPAITGR